jgi:hypothetical protein
MFAHWNLTVFSSFLRNSWLLATRYFVVLKTVAKQFYVLGSTGYDCALFETKWFPRYSFLFQFSIARIWTSEFWCLLNPLQFLSLFSSSKLQFRNSSFPGDFSLAESLANIFKVFKSALRIIFPHLSYQNALQEADLDKMEEKFSPKTFSIKLYKIHCKSYMHYCQRKIRPMSNVNIY